MLPRRAVGEHPVPASRSLSKLTGMMNMRQLTRQSESFVLVHWGLRYAWEYCNCLRVPDTFPDKTKKLIVKRVDRYQLSDGHPFSW